MCARAPQHVHFDTHTQGEYEAGGEKLRTTFTGCQRAARYAMHHLRKSASTIELRVRGGIFSDTEAE